MYGTADRRAMRKARLTSSWRPIFARQAVKSLKQVPSHECQTVWVASDRQSAVKCHKHLALQVLTYWHLPGHSATSKLIVGLYIYKLIFFFELLALVSDFFKYLFSCVLTAFFKEGFAYIWDEWHSLLNIQVHIETTFIRRQPQYMSKQLNSTFHSCSKWAI